MYLFVNQHGNEAPCLPLLWLAVHAWIQDFQQGTFLNHAHATIHVWIYLLHTSVRVDGPIHQIRLH